METGHRPVWWYVILFELFTLVFFLFQLRPHKSGERDFRGSFVKGLAISGIATCLTPFTLLCGMIFMKLFFAGFDNNLTLAVFGPTHPVLFTIIIAFLSSIFSTLMASGWHHLNQRGQSLGGKSFDIFFSFSKMDLGEGMPSDGMLYDNLFRQIRKADQLGFKRAWIGEAHFSIRTEQHKPEPLLPHFNGELCINTDILQVASFAQAQTKQIEIGSAIRNILVNGGPIAHAEAIRTFLTIHQDELKKSGRKLQIGFGVGRFAYANEVYGIKARNEVERILWPAIRGLVLRQATEIFLRLLKGEILGSEDLNPSILYRKSIKNEEDWLRAIHLLGKPGETTELNIPPFWEFQAIKLIPEDCDLSCLELTLGSHDPELQVFANQFLPVRVFNLSVTPGRVIDETHERMSSCFHPDGGPWKREFMPRTIMIFTCAEVNLSKEEQDQKGFEEARAAMIAYWKAMEGTVDQAKVEGGMENAVYGSPEKVKRMLEEKFHPEDRLMTWFDFNTNDSGIVMKRMEDFMVHVKPLFDA
jgi:alkanesulfonate monooxygenase SsuD/methylene tetrahydromethanopterin reductase-like flavin-dependent oxidoreductase (luciferase family)